MYTTNDFIYVFFCKKNKKKENTERDLMFREDQ